MDWENHLEKNPIRKIKKCSKSVVKKCSKSQSEIAACEQKNH